MLAGLAKSHDLRLSPWGPYHKRYAGVAHVPDLDLGVLFGLSIAPTLFRRRSAPPCLVWEAGHHPWEASPNLDYWKYRHELIWKDRFYCEVECCRVEGLGVLMRSEFVNAGKLPENGAIHYLASVTFPPKRPREDAPINAAKLVLPAGALWLDALDYKSLDLPGARTRDGLELAGARKGEQPCEGFVGGFGLEGLAESVGARADFDLPAERPSRCELWLRLLVPAGSRVRLSVHGALAASVCIEGSGVPECSRLGSAEAGEFSRFSVVCEEAAAGARLDGFALVAEEGAPVFEPIIWNPEPKQERLGERALRLCYDHVPAGYTIAWKPEAPSSQRTLETDDLDRLLQHKAHDHVSEALSTGKGQHYTDVFLKPITVPPGETRVLRALVAHGQREDGMLAAKWMESVSAGAFDDLCEQGRKRLAHMDALPAGRTLRFGVDRMVATTLTNVVFPTRIHGRWNRHFTPGKWWDSPYTWDSGMIALGLAQIAPERAVECINAYLTEPDDPDNAFVHWGSPVPTQFYAFQEVWNMSGGSDALARYFFPRLRRYHRFLVGRDPKSRTLMASGLIRTFDYFYNSGGWDDYPAQKKVHREGLAGRVAPAGNTAHSIRCAKMLAYLAERLGEDTGEFEEDVRRLAGALQTHAWDAAAETFSYTVHDEKGRALGPLRHEAEGVNMNLGMDGALPLIAGICDAKQRDALLGRLFSPEGCRTPIGLTAVAQSAPYHAKDGYWNGAVWMPHQWFIWKSLLDLGRADEAWWVASTALELWNREVEETYHCFEHFLVESGRGAGWHCFSGLSCPILAWFRAYYGPGSIQVGFDGWIEHRTRGADGNNEEAVICFQASRLATDRIILVVVPAPDLRPRTDAPAAAMRERHPGCWEIRVPAGIDRVRLLIER